MSCPVHPVPGFGCSECIRLDLEAWASKAYKAWAMSYKPPACKKCGGPTEPFFYELTKDGLKAVVGCLGFDDAKGFCKCSDEDFEVKICQSASAAP